MSQAVHRPNTPEMVKVTHNSVKDVKFENVDGMGPVKEFPWNLLQKWVDNKGIDLQLYWKLQVNKNFCIA